MTPRIWADQLMIYAKDDPTFTRLAESFEAESPGNKAEGASSAADFFSILNRYTNLKQINFYTHGNVGYVHLAGGGVYKETAAHVLAAPHPSLFSGVGRVLFIGCNVGEGEQGLIFLIAAGKALLKGRGGFIGGTTSTNFGDRWGMFDVLMPFWGDLRVVELDAAGKIVAQKLF